VGVGREEVKGKGRERERERVVIGRLQKNLQNVKQK
jgi:hypothetical protein